MKNPIKFMKSIIVFSISFIVLYTVVQTIISYLIGMELSPTLTTCVYTFFGTELVVCALIKIFEKSEKAENSNLEHKDTSTENIQDEIGNDHINSAY